MWNLDFVEKTEIPCYAARSKAVDLLNERQKSYLKIAVFHFSYLIRSCDPGCRSKLVINAPDKRL